MNEGEKMYVIHRCDKDYGDFTKVHETLGAAEEEARRLAAKHATEKASFMVYELRSIREISARIVLMTTTSRRPSNSPKSPLFFIPKGC